MTNPVITSVTFDKTSYNVGDTITCTVKYSDANTHGVTAGNGTFTPVGTIIKGDTATPSITTTAVGDVILFHVITEGSAPVTGITGGNCTWTQLGTTFTGTVNAGFSASVWQGKVTAAGTAVATIATTGTPTAIRAAGQEYQSSTGQIVLVTQATLDSTGGTTGPAITPTGANQLYSTFLFSTGTTTAGSTAGFTYEFDNHGNAYAFNPACALTSQAPVMGDASNAFGIAVLVNSSLPVGTFTAIGSLIQSLTGTVTVNPQQLGDLVLLHVFTLGSAPATGITGGNCNWTQLGMGFNGTVQAGFNCTVWAGTAIATGSAPATVKFNGTPTSVIIQGQEYYSSTGHWQLVTQTGLDGTGTAVMPAMSPTAAGQLCAWGTTDSATSTAGPTSGYRYYTDANGNGYCFDPACSTSPQSPAFGDATHGFGLGVILSTGGTSSGGGSGAVASSPLIASIATAAGVDPFGNPYPEGISSEVGQVSGSSFAAGNTIKIDATGLHVYNGAPVPGNEQLSITPTVGFVTKAPIVVNQFGQGTPQGNPQGGATVFSGHGDIQVVDGLDQQAYATQRRTIATGGDQNITSTTFATFLSSHVAAGNASAREYRIYGKLFIAPNQTGGKIGLRWTGPGATIGHVDFSYKSPASSPATSNDESGALGNGVSTTGVITATMALGFETDVVVDGVIQVPAGVSGAFTLDAAEGTAGDSFIIRQFSYVDVMPV